MTHNLKPLMIATQFVIPEYEILRGPYAASNIEQRLQAERKKHEHSFESEMAKYEIVHCRRRAEWSVERDFASNSTLYRLVGRYVVRKYAPPPP